MAPKKQDINDRPHYNAGLDMRYFGTAHDQMSQDERIEAGLEDSRPMISAITKQHGETARFETAGILEPGTYRVTSKPNKSFLG